MLGSFVATPALLAGALIFAEADDEAWPRLPATDGNAYSLSDFEDSQVVVLVFTGNSCPVAADYNQRLGALAGQFDPREVRFVAVNVADGLGESMEEMKDQAVERPFLYLKDEQKLLARRFHARVTPHVFVLAGESRAVVYQGAIDDCPGDASAVTRPFLEQAIRAALEHRTPPVRSSTPKGCSILY